LISQQSSQPLYISGLIGPGDRKSIQPMAERLALGEYDQLHHFIAAGVWDAAPVETELLVQADRLVGGVGRNPARTARSLSFAPADGARG
jgi:SRSO17 transposase